MNLSTEQLMEQQDAKQWSRRAFSLAVASVVAGIPGCRVGPDFASPPPPRFEQ